MFSIEDQYSKVYEFTPNNTVQTGSNFWFHSNTTNAKTGFKAVLATNRSGTTASFRTYSYGDQKSTQTNYILLSENIQNGLTLDYNRQESTATAQGWFNYGASSVTGVYSNTLMPDGSTNGVLMQTIVDANNGIYQPLKQSSVLTPGRMYTVSVWACVDTVGSFPSTGKMRFSYYNGSVSTLSPDISLTTTPQRVSWTFVANNALSNQLENIAIGNGSGSPAAIRMVLWGAQLVEGNTAGGYLPTNQEYNGLRSIVSPPTAVVGSATASTGAAVSGDYQIIDAQHTVRANSSILLNTEAFAIATTNLAGVAPPSNLFIYGLY